MFRDLHLCKGVSADASETVLSSGRGDLAPTIFGEGIVVTLPIPIQQQSPLQAI